MQEMKLTVHLTVILALAGNGCVAEPKLEEQDSRVKIYSRTSLLPHGYGDSILEFKGRRYHQLASAGYALVPGKNMIVFVTDAHFEGRVLHFVPIDHGKAIRVKLGDAPFGGQIGGHEGNPDTDYIESVDGDRITFATRILFGPNAGRIVRSVVDLNSQTFRRDTY
jgi:hypothetical protein